MALTDKLTNLAARRIGAGLPQETLARRANVSLDTVARAEHHAATDSRGFGTGVVDIDEQARLASILGTTTTDFRGDA